MTRLLLVVALVGSLLAGGGSPTEPSGEQHGPEGGGGEPGESGTQYSLTDTATETRAGVRLVMSFDSARSVFSGTVTNTTDATVSEVRVEIHPSNGVELGPTPRQDLKTSSFFLVWMLMTGTLSAAQRWRSSVMCR